MQHRKLSLKLIISTGVLLLSGIAVLMIAQAQAPERSTIAVATSGAEGFGIYLLDPEKPAAPAEKLLEVEGDPIPGGLEWSLDGAKIAFHTQIGQNIDIYVVNGDGKGLKQLTDHEAEDSWPAWHPSGQKLAFTSNRDGNLEIYTMTGGGEIVANLTNDSAPDKNPAWSPNGRNIAFSTKRGRTLSDIWLMDSAGGNLKNLTNHKGEDLTPSWSWDGQTIAFTTRRFGAGRTMRMDPDGGNLLEISARQVPRLDPEFSPDGKEIANVWFGGGQTRLHIWPSDGGLADADEHAAPVWKEIALGFPSAGPAWFDPDFVVPFSVSSADKRPLSWGWLKSAGLEN